MEAEEQQEMIFAEEGPIIPFEDSRSVNSKPMEEPRGRPDEIIKLSLETRNEADTEEVGQPDAILISPSYPDSVLPTDEIGDELNPTPSNDHLTILITIICLIWLWVLHSREGTTRTTIYL